MYIEEFCAGGPLSSDIADELSWKTAIYTSRILVIIEGRKVSAGCLPMCWQELKLAAGIPVVVMVHGGCSPPDEEDRRAIKDFAEAFKSLTAATGAHTNHPAPARRERFRKAPVQRRGVFSRSRSA